MLSWPETACLDDGAGRLLNTTGMQLSVAALAGQLAEGDRNCALALAGDNHPDWIIADLAAAMAARAVVPVPGFFTDEQIAHVCTQAGVHEVLLNGQLMPVQSVWPHVNPSAYPQRARNDRFPTDTQKITFTSGTTGQPKGICLTWSQQQATAASLVQKLSALQVQVHLNLLPLSVLLENIAGVHAPLMMGARVVTPSLAQVGLRGSSEFDARRCVQSMIDHRAESVILLPQMLQAIVAVLQAAPDLLKGLSSLKFVAVGGAPTPSAVLDAARAMGLPVYEGYGLTECASVCCLNSPDADCPGTVGTPLPGLQVGLTDDGEVWVRGRSHAGVLGVDADESPDADRIMTGDLGQWVEHDGKQFLRIVGRRKHVLITSFGRNVSPEWPERLLMDSGLLRQAVVMGDGLPHLQAVVVPVQPGLEARVAHLVERANSTLPDYARIAQWHVSTEPFTAANGLATANGRPIRQRIAAHFAAAFHD